MRLSSLILVLFVGMLALASCWGEGPKEPPMLCPWKAVGRMNYEGGVGSIGSSGAAILPRRPDGQWDILGAAHAVGPVGSKATFRDKAGKNHEVVVLAKDKESDVAWLVTVEKVDLPAVELAKRDSENGLACWHCGAGVDKPANVEYGEVLRGKAEGVKGYRAAKFNLSVSHGDAGGPVFDRSGKVIGLVSATLAVEKKSEVYGASVEQILALRQRHSAEPDAGRPAPNPLPPMALPDGNRETD